MKRVRIPFWLLFTGAVLLTGSALARDAEDVFIAASPDNPSLYQIATAISRQLETRNIDSTIIDAGKGKLSVFNKAGIIISVGNAVSQRITRLAPDKPLIAITTSIMAADNTSAHTQLLIQQPPCRQLRLIKNLSDQFRSVSVIASNNRHRDTLKRCASNNGLTLRFYRKTKDTALAKLIAQALQGDIILALPDHEIYNPKTVKTILLQSYRKRIPLIGFSRSFVKAGALAAIYSTPEQIAGQVSDLVQQWLEQGSLSGGVTFPRDYHVLINNQVSNALQLDLPPTDIVRNKLLAGESDE